MDNNYQSSICLDLEKALADESVAPIDLRFWFLKAITQDFSDDQLIGIGGFGSVYKGVLPNGIIVAVKKLHDNKLIEVQEKHFLHEVDCLIEVKHRNIVRFLGYSYETQHMLYLHKGRNVLVDKRNMLFCFEFLSKGSLANYVTDASSGLEWSVRYQIIKGICEGVAYLHKRRIIHMDLKPENILLDNTMAPKITDFGISRRFRENQSKIITGNIVGSLGYMAPEFLRNGTISFGTDMYSLGVIIIQILTGSKECPNVNMVLESWTNTFGTSKSNPPLEQVKLCVEIGICCMHDDPSKRPHIQDIIRRLNETDISVQQLGRFYQYYRQAKQACKPMRIIASMAPELRPCWSSESALLDVHPLELCFPFEAKKVTQCPLNLVNRTHQYVAWIIRQQFQDMYAIDQRISYDLRPMSTVVLTVKMVRQETPPLDAGMFEILMISMESKKDLQNLESSIDNDSQKNDDDLLKRVEELDGEVHAAVLKAVVCPPKDPAPKVISRVGFGEKIRTMDVHSTQPWILVGRGKLLSLWYYEMEVTTVFPVDIKDKPENLYRRMIHGHENARVTSVRFIPRTEWCVAGDSWGYIHVYTCLTMDEIKSFNVTGRGPVKSLAIHPTCPYLLSVSEYIDDEVIEIWDWEKGWACCREVHDYYSITHATFNPMDANTFVSSHCYDGVIKVWSINPSADQPITTIRCPDLWRHDHVFTEAAGPNHVVVSGVNRDPQIWDLQTGTLVHTFSYDTRFSGRTAVTCHPTLPLVASGVVDFLDDDAHPAVCFWNSTNYRLEKTVRCTSNSPITYLGFVGSRRLVIGTENEIQVVEIDMESLACQQ